MQDLSLHGIVALVRNRDGKFLLLEDAREHMKGRWAPPHGRCEQADKLERNSVIREVKEETGLTVWPVRVVVTQSADTHVKTVSFWLVSIQDRDNTDIHIQLDNESSDFGWFTVEEALQLPLYPGSKMFFEQVMRHEIDLRMPEHYAHHYPYPSTSKQESQKLRRGRDYEIWQKPGFDIKQLLQGVNGPIIEIGGPTESGFYFLDTIELPSRPIITNLTPEQPTSKAEAAKLAPLVDDMVDGTKMPYDNASVGMYLMSGMSVTSDWYVDLPEVERDSKADQIEAEFDIARLEMEQVAIGTLRPSDVRYAQRIPTYLEMHRTLVPEGILMTDGLLAEINVLRAVGFDIMAYTQELVRPDHGWDGILYQIVAQKRQSILSLPSEQMTL